VEELELRPPRIAAPRALERLCTADPHERAGHAYGKSYRDLVRALRREFPSPPDLVALPESEQDVAALLDWCAGSGIAVVPYGGGSSVVGGVEPDVDDRFTGAVSLDLCRLGRVLRVDERSRAAEVEAGVLGPALEEQLKPHGLTFRHFPQSFEFSTLGMLAGSVETAVTWDRFEELHTAATRALEDAGRAACGQVLVASRLAYAYPDGAAPYYTFVAPARAGAELEQWDAVKDAVSRAILDHGGTITHHHAVGRDHRRWYDEERPELFASALRAAKRALDPAGILNPGVLLDG